MRSCMSSRNIAIRLNVPAVTLDGKVIDAANIFRDIQHKSRPLVSMEKDHIPDTTIGQSRAKDRNIIFGSPVQD